MVVEQQTISSSVALPPVYSVTQTTMGQHPLQPAPPGGVPYLLFIPENFSISLLPLVLVHGISRNAQQHLEAFSGLARQTGRMLIAPLFDERHCKRYQQARTRHCDADQMLLAVLQDVRRISSYLFKQIILFGFSGGAQFGHRFAMLHPETVNQLAIASAGWYTFPDHQQAFPYGISNDTCNGNRLTDNLPYFLSIPMLVMAGELDIKRDANLRKSKAIDRQQGLSRTERAARWARALQQKARMLNVQFDIALNILPNSTHDFGQCIQQGQLVACVTNWLAGNTICTKYNGDRSKLSRLNLMAPKAQGKTLGRPPSLSSKQQELVHQKINKGESISAIAREFNTSRQIILRIRDQS